MDPAPLQITLPESLKEFVEAETAHGGYASASDYVAQVLADARRRKAIEKIDDLIEEGLNSGPGIEVTPEFWDDLKQRVLARQTRRQDS